MSSVLQAPRFASPHLAPPHLLPHPTQLPVLATKGPISSLGVDVGCSLGEGGWVLLVGNQVDRGS